jgi:hypothetical protein
MGFIGGRPFRDGPEGIHHSSGAIGKFIGEPPLRAERSVGRSRKALKISYPIVGPIRRFLVGRVSRLRVIERFHGGKPRTVAVATLIWHIAAKILEAAALFGCDGGAMNDIFGPSRGGLHPLNQFA